MERRNSRFRELMARLTRARSPMTPVVLLSLVVATACGGTPPSQTTATASAETTMPAIPQTTISVSETATVEATPPTKQPDPKKSFACEQSESAQAVVCSTEGLEQVDVRVALPPQGNGSTLTAQALVWTLDDPSSPDVNPRDDTFTPTTRILNFHVFAENAPENTPETYPDQAVMFDPPFRLQVPYTAKDLSEFRDRNPSLSPEKDFVVRYWHPEQRWIPIADDEGEDFYFVAGDPTAKPAPGEFTCDTDEPLDAPPEDGGFGCAIIRSLPDPHTVW
jgi:hypothetical protein